MSCNRIHTIYSVSIVILQRYLLPCFFAGLLIFNWSPGEPQAQPGINQSAFLNILKNYSSKYVFSRNQTQQVSIIKDRDEAVHRLLHTDGAEFRGWIVTLYDKSTTKSGTTLAFRCGFDPEVKLIAAALPDSSPPSRFTDIPEHAILLLDGRFLPSGNGNYEQSFTERGSVKSPKYHIEILRVKSLQPEPETAPRPWPAQV
jgi:hypothetical protein